MKNEKLDIEKEMEAIDKQLNEGFEGFIKEVVETTNHKFFGENSGNFDERKGYALTVKLESPNGEEFKEFYSKPSIRGYKQSNIEAFRKKYGQAPKVGMKIKCHIDENGFFRVTK